MKKNKIKSVILISSIGLLVIISSTILLYQTQKKNPESTITPNIIPTMIQVGEEYVVYPGEQGFYVIMDGQEVVDAVAESEIDTYVQPSGTEVYYVEPTEYGIADNEGQITELKFNSPKEGESEVKNEK